MTSVALVSLAFLTGCGIKGYQIVYKQEYASINKGEILYLEAVCPDGKVVIGGGANTQSLPLGSAANYTLKSSKPVDVFAVGGHTYKWGALWTNATDFEHPQVVGFTVSAICAEAQ